MGIVKVTRRDSILPSHHNNLALLITLQTQVSLMPTMDASSSSQPKYDVFISMMPCAVKVSIHSSMAAISRGAKSFHQEHSATVIENSNVFHHSLV